MRLAELCAAIAVVAGATVGQVAQGPSFEVASVRPSGPQSTGPAGARQWKNGGAGTNDPERLTYTLMPFRYLLMDSYGVQLDQIAGPAWIEERYDIAAKVPRGATRAEQDLMLRGLLIERFHLSVRMEAREMPGYVLTVAKGGPKLKESVVDPDVKPLKLADCRTSPDKDGVPQLPAGCRGPIIVRPRDSGKTYVVARQAPIARFVGALIPSLNAGEQRIDDKTGLTGNYDFRLGFSQTGLSAKASAGQEPSDLPDLFSALEKQLGLKLEKTKLSINMLIVDHGDKVPAEN
jgi:uncharacterized protein (TIGR03435 family)